MKYRCRICGKDWVGGMCPPCAIEELRIHLVLTEEGRKWISRYGEDK